MMNKPKIKLNLLMDAAAANFVYLRNTGNWKTEITRNTQIIVLTMQISELESKVSKLTDRTSTGQSTTPCGGTGASAFNCEKYIFELWHLKKANNKAEHNMIEWDEKTWYWCNNHTHNNKGVVTQSMYIFHEPDREHDAWQAKKD